MSMRSNRKSRLSTGLPVLALAFAMLLPMQASAAGGDYLDVSYTAQKAGNYYFKVVSPGKLKMSKSKKGPWKTVSFSKKCWSYQTDGKMVYAVLDFGITEPQQLTSYRIKDGKTEVLYSLTQGRNSQDPDSYSLEAGYKNTLYLTRRSEKRWSLTTYSYGLKTGKLKKQKSNCGLIARHGTYAVGENEMVTDVSARKMTLYRLKNNGNIKKVKRLGKHVGTATFVKGKLYYTVCSDNAMRDATLYRADANGKHVKKLGRFRAKEEYGLVMVNNIGAKSCELYMDGTQYRYTYKTGKKTKL